MALSKSLSKGQIPLGCQLCESGARIQWKCVDCILLICSTCKKLHLKITRDHRIVDIKSVSFFKECQVCEKETKLQWKCDDCQLFLCDSCKNGHLKIPATKDHKINVIECESQTFEARKSGDGRRIKFKVVKQFPVDAKLIHMAVSQDGSIWLSDGVLGKLLHIKLSDDGVNVLSTIDIRLYSLAITPSGSPIVSVNETSTNKIVNELTGQIHDSKFSIDPWLTTCVHVTKDENFIMGGVDGTVGVVILMNKDGKQLMKYDKDKDKPLLTYPRHIASTRNGNIFIVDSYRDLRSRLVVIKQGGDIRYYYGHDDINSHDKPLFISGILVTPRDNVLTIDYHTDTLYILNNEGDFITYFNLSDIGILKPSSMALSQAGAIYIGNDKYKDQKDVATLFEVEYSGV